MKMAAIVGSSTILQNSLRRKLSIDISRNVPLVFVCNRPLKLSRLFVSLVSPSAAGRYDCLLKCCYLKKYNISLYKLFESLFT